MLQSSPDTEGREAKLFEWYARVVWPIHRIFVRGLSKRCRHCCVSEKYALLNEQRMCKECLHGVTDEHHEANAHQEEMKQDLDRILTQARGRGRYDALVLFSGGKDSTLLIHLLKTQYPKLRILAFTFDNGFMSQTAMDNIQRIIGQLNIDHIVVRPRVGFCEQVFGYAIAHVGDHGCSGVVDPIDGALIFDAARHHAAQSKIPLILIGLSPDQLKQYENWTSFEADPQFEHSKRTHATIFPIEELSPGDTSFWWDATRYPEEDIARVIYPFVAWRFDEEYIKKKVVELGFMEQKNTSPLVTNSQLIPLENVVDIFHLGYSSWEPEFTRMIRGGRADRRFWRNVFELVEYASKTGTFISGSVDSMLLRLHLSREELGIK